MTREAQRSSPIGNVDSPSRGWTFARLDGANSGPGRMGGQRRHRGQSLAVPREQSKVKEGGQNSPLALRRAERLVANTPGNRQVINDGKCIKVHNAQISQRAVFVWFRWTGRRPFPGDKFDPLHPLADSFPLALALRPKPSAASGKLRRVEGFQNRAWWRDRKGEKGHGGRQKIAN